MKIADAARGLGVPQVVLGKILEATGLADEDPPAEPPAD